MRKSFNLLLPLLLIFATLSPVVTHAAAASIVELDFSSDSTNDSALNTWVDFGTVTYSGGKAIFDNGGIVTSDTTAFENSINAQEDFYLEMNFDLNSIDYTNGYQPLFAEATAQTRNFIVLYSGDTASLQIWTADGASSNKLISIPTTLIAGVDYNIVLSKEGSDIKYYKDGVLVSTTPIGHTLFAQSGSQMSVGTNQDTYALANMSHVTVVTGAGYTIGAPSGDTEVDIIGGDLSLTANPINFSSVTIDNTMVTTTSTSSTVEVDDSRGTAEGWSLKLSSSNFKTNSVTDPSSGGTGSFVVSIPASSVALSVDPITADSGQSIDSTYGPLGSDITLGSSAQTIVNASPGFGAGYYEIPLSIQLTVPKTATIVSESGTGSKYAVNDSIGVLAGTYTGTITYTVGAGL